MEEEKDKKEISNKKAIISIIVVIVLLIILGMIYAIGISDKNCKDTIVKNDKTYEYSIYPTDEFINLEEYVNCDTYLVEGQKNIKNLYSLEIDNKLLKDGVIINNASELEELMDECTESHIGIYTNKYVQWEKNSVIAYIYYNNTAIPLLGAKVTQVNYYKNLIDIDLAVAETRAEGVDENAQLIIIITDKIESNSELKFNINKYDAKKYLTPEISVDKPIIYIYPTEETKVNVKVGRPENLTHTYPKYNDGWEVIAKPSGDLTDTNTGRNLYSLYWEGINTVEPNMNEGFIVKGEDTIDFLEEKLSVLGLNDREANEFIIYWLPKLESNKYNFIRFQTQEEINNNMPLEITPKPDTVIRVVMEFKGLEEPIGVQEQRLETPERTGYTVVEWGGTEVR